MKATMLLTWHLNKTGVLDVSVLEPHSTWRSETRRHLLVDFAYTLPPLPVDIGPYLALYVLVLVCLLRNRNAESKKKTKPRGLFYLRFCQWSYYHLYRIKIVDTRVIRKDHWRPIYPLPTGGCFVRPTNTQTAFLPLNPTFQQLSLHRQIWPLSFPLSDVQYILVLSSRVLENV